MTERQTRVHVEAKETRSHATTSVLFSRVLLIVLLVLASYSMLVSQAGAAGPPTAATLAATSVTATSAVLHGTVNPNGVVTIWDFSNPPTTMIYCPSPAASLPADNVAHPVSCTATGLTPSTYYEYIVRASSDGGNSFGSPVGFTTAAAGGTPTVVTMPATDVTATSAVLHGTVNPNGLVTRWDFTGWINGMSPGDRMIYCGGPDLPGDTATHVVSCQATGLTPSTTYWYKIRASNSASTGAGPHGTDVSFTTLPATATTDWAVTSIGIQPPSPQVGDQVTLGATVIVLSTTGGYPQNFVAQCILDGSSCGSGTLTYPGPTGVAFTVTSESTWIATAGAHSLSWQVSTTNDPNPGNNFGSYSFSVAAPTPFEFDIAVSPNSLTVQPGQTQSATMNVNLKSGTAQAVSLTVSGQPAGVTAALNPTSGTPTFSSTMTIAVSGTTSPGTYTLSLSGSGGGQSHSVPFVLTVSMAPDFRIDLSPASQSALQGQTSSYSINVVGSNGFNSQVSLSVTGLPSGANGVFSTSSGTPTYPSTLAVTLSSSTPSGSYTLVIHGSGGGLDRTANAVLTVTGVTTQTQTTSQTTTTATVGLVEMLQQNSLLLIAGLAILVIVLAALAMRGRGRPAGPQAMGASQVFCGRCGTANPLANEFCSNCGSRLKGSTGAG